MPTPTPAGDAVDDSGIPEAVEAPAPPQTSYLPPTQAPDPLIGQTLAGRYLIERKLGEGGMGAVYLARHSVLEKQVALKVLHGELNRKPELVERFMQEAKSASRIRHENVIDISDFGSTSEGYVFFAMELLSGHDLHDVIARARFAGELLPWERSKHIFLQICGALSAAHRHGIVHRDLKPENVYLVNFLGDEDFVKLLDFGIAKLTEGEGGERKLTRTGMLFGTPEYMSPEQARGEHVDHRIDIYAMGCMLFQLVTGRVPFEADNFMGVLTKHLTDMPPEIPPTVFDRIGAPRELAGVIAQALVKDRTQRYQTIDDLANAVRLVCGEAPLAPGMGRLSGGIRTMSVPAPSETVRARTPIPSASTPMPAAVSAAASTPMPAAKPTPVPAEAAAADASESAASTASKKRVEWTGKPAVPEEADRVPEPRRAKSKLPLVLGAVVLLGGAAAAVFLATRGGDEPAPPVADTGSGSGSGSAEPPVAVAPTPAPVPTPTPTPPAVAPTPPPPPPEEPLPAKVVLALDSKPRGAVVKDLTTGAVLGKTPKSIPVTPGRSPRQYALTLRGYAEAQIEIIPDRAKIEHTEILEKGEPGKPARPKTVVTPPNKGQPTTTPGKGEPVTPPGTTPTPPGKGEPVTAPPVKVEPTPPVKVEPPPVKVEPTPPVKPPPPDDPDCPEQPCLKADPSRRGG